ncbi:hypothetical protein [Paenibacillus sp. SER-28]
MVDIGSEQYLFHTGHGYWLAPGESYQIAPLNGTVPEYYKITFEVIALPSEPQADMALGKHAVRMPSYIMDLSCRDRANASSPLLPPNLFS